MGSPTEPTYGSHDNVDAFTVQVLRYLDGTCAAEEIHQLRETLVASAAHRQLFVKVCRLHGHLHESFAPKRAEMEAKKASAEIAAGRTVAKATAGAGAANQTTDGGRVACAPAESMGATDADLSTDLLDEIPGAETVVIEPSPEDTVNPTPKKAKDA